MRIEDILPIARGKVPADLLLKNAKVVNVFSGEIEETNVAIFRKRIAGLGRDYTKGKKVIDLEGAYLVPGLIDAHVHIESSMVDPVQFARAVLIRGTTTVIADPHEIANVAGLKGVEYILNYTEGIPLNIYVMIPSCVPATSMEGSGAEISVVDMIGFVEKHPRVLGLGEVMNFPGVINGDRDVIAKIELLRHKYKKIDGHCPSLGGKDLNAYICAFIRSDHECATLEEAREKLSRGMQILIREGSAARNLDDLIPLFNEMNHYFISFCTDDKHPDDILEEGHIDYMVRRSIQKGVPPVMAIRAATINTARHYNLRSMGAIAPGYKADMVVVDNLYDFKPRMVIKDAVVVAEDGELKVNIVGAPCSSFAVESSFRCPFISRDDLLIKVKGRKVRVIGLKSRSIYTEEGMEEIQRAENGVLLPDPERDLLEIAIINRHKPQKIISKGILKGLGLRRGAIATSVGHDSHNLCVVGADLDDMVFAANEIISIGGGLVVVSDGKVLGKLPLPIGGLMSVKSMETVAGEVRNLKRITKELGSKLDDPFMTLSFVQLPVIPEIRITDKGIVDVRTFSLVPLFL